MAMFQRVQVYLSVYASGQYSLYIVQQPVGFDEVSSWWILKRKVAFHRVREELLVKDLQRMESPLRAKHIFQLDQMLLISKVVEIKHVIDA